MRILKRVGESDRRIVPLYPAVMLAACLATASSVRADAQWVGGSGVPLNIWTDPANWDPVGAPASATDQGVGDANVVRMPFNGTTALIDASVNAVAFGVHIGSPISGTLGSQSASNTLNMTGGTLTTQGNFLLNVGRGRNALPGHLVQLNITGGVVNAAGITVPEAFSPDSVIGFTSMGMNAEMHVSGDAIVNTDLLRLGAFDSNSLVTISDNAQINLTDDNNGFASGALWIEAFEAPIVGTSLLDIRDNAKLTIHGEWWTDENGNGERDIATATELQYFIDNYITPGLIVANGGANPVYTRYERGVITMQATPFVPAPAGLAAGLLGLAMMAVRRGRSS